MTQLQEQEYARLAIALNCTIREAEIKVRNSLLNVQTLNFVVRALGRMPTEVEARAILKHGPNVLNFMNNATT